jgi:SAM-dependent methyltransferase
MGFFDDEKNVQSYIDMTDGYDGRELIETLKKHVPQGSAVLELGMGPGKDLDILNEYYLSTGSDNSDMFLKRYRATHKDADLLLLDAASLETDRSFDCIYSNKVLMHLTTDQMKRSLMRQCHILNHGGILFHSFWEGDHLEEMNGLLFVYYSKEKLAAMFNEIYDVLEIEYYTEMEKDDSIYIVARKRKPATHIPLIRY